MAISLSDYSTLNPNSPDVPQPLKFGGEQGFAVDSFIQNLTSNPNYVMTPADFAAYYSKPYGGEDLSSLTSGIRTATQQATQAQDTGWQGFVNQGLAPILASAAFGGLAAGAAGGGVAGGIESAGGIPELGLVANPATAEAAVAGGIPASMLSGGPGALTLGDFSSLPPNGISQAAQRVAAVDPVTGQPAISPPASPSAPAAAPSAPGGSPLGATGSAQGVQGGTSFVDKILQDMKNHPIQSLGLGLSAAGMLATGKQKQPQQLGQLSSLGTTGQATAQQLLDQYKSGQLSGPQQASLDQLSRNAKNQINQYFSSIGQSDSTSHAQALAQVDQQAEAMKNQILTDALNSGLQAIGVASGPLTTAAQIQLSQDKNLQQAFANFAQALGTFGGKSAQQTANPQPTQQVQSAQQNIGV